MSRPLAETRPAVQGDWPDSLPTSIVHDSDDAILCNDLAGIIRSWNKAAERIFGYTAAEALGQPISILASPGQPNELPDVLTRIRRGERVEHYEAVGRRKDGEVINVSVTASAVRNAAGEIVGCSKIARDITDRKKAEESLRALNAHLSLLAASSSELLNASDTDRVLRAALDLARRFGPADAYAVWQTCKDNAAWVLGASSGFLYARARTKITFPSMDGRLPHAAFVIADIAAEQRLAHRHESMQREGFRSMLVVPLHVHGRPPAAITFYRRSTFPFSEADVQIASALGKMTTAALGVAEYYNEERELRAEAQRAGARAALLAEAGAILAGSLDYKDALRRVAKLAIPDFAEWCAVDLLVDGEYAPAVLEHEDPRKLQPLWEYRERHVSPLDDPAQTVFEAGVLIVVPLMKRERKLGLMTFARSRRGRPFSDAELRLTEELARRASTAIESAQLYADVSASEARYRSLVSATASIVWTVDPRGAFIAPQPSWEAYTGQTWEEHRGLGWKAAIHPDDLERIRRLFVDNGGQATAYEVEGRLWHAASRQYRYYVARAAPVRRSDGSIVEWIGTTSDIHERKLAEEKRSARSGEEQECAARNSS